ncbi:MAG TPA: DUF4199 domain-containing protein [Steroidobacteraceae bacterium]|nr:DUF4199 domain-containing protein [Steroidobacteraceae bacterium]
MQQQRAHGIAAIATKYGLILGVVSFLIFLAQVLTGLKQNWVVSVANIALLIVLMALAHGEFRRTHSRMMTYPQGLGSGTLLASVGALIRSILTFIYLKYINTGYLTALVQAQRSALAQRGITGAQAQMAGQIAATITTPAGIAVTSLVTGVILGFVVALIVSIFTQKSDPMAVV